MNIEINTTYLTHAAYMQAVKKYLFVAKLKKKRLHHWYIQSLNHRQLGKNKWQENITIYSYEFKNDRKR